MSTQRLPGARAGWGVLVVVVVVIGQVVVKLPGTPSPPPPSLLPGTHL